MLMGLSSRRLRGYGGYSVNLIPRLAEQDYSDNLPEGRNEVL
jgi:hypothetical protein